MIEQRVQASDVVAGDFLVARNIDGTDWRARVLRTERLQVPIDYPGQEPRRVTYDAIRLHFTAGGSLDYAPDLQVQIIRP